MFLTWVGPVFIVVSALVSCYVMRRDSSERISLWIVVACGLAIIVVNKVFGLAGTPSLANYNAITEPYMPFSLGILMLAFSIGSHRRGRSLPKPVLFLGSALVFSASLLLLHAVFAANVALYIGAAVFLVLIALELRQL
jgi:peptidoglycan/LPS O-acetylase OafA/YrhL